MTEVALEVGMEVADLVVERIATYRGNCVDIVGCVRPALHEPATRRWIAAAADYSPATDRTRVGFVAVVITPSVDAMTVPEEDSA